jgi:hypothetical protein
MRRREYPAATRPQHPGDLAHDRGRVGHERHRPEGSERHIEAGVAERQPLRVRLDERYLDPGCGRAGGCVPEHASGQVTCDRHRALPHQPA